MSKGDVVRISEHVLNDSEKWRIAYAIEEIVDSFAQEKRVRHNRKWTHDAPFWQLVWDENGMTYIMQISAVAKQRKSGTRKTCVSVLGWGHPVRDQKITSPTVRCFPSIRLKPEHYKIGKDTSTYRRIKHAFEKVYARTRTLKASGVVDPSGPTDCLIDV
jgi:hypothetical protein